MRTQLIKVLVLTGTSVREYNEILREKNMKFDSDPDLAYRLIQERREDESAAKAQKLITQLFTN